jgi:hypothetical protein
MGSTRVPQTVVRSVMQCGPRPLQAVSEEKHRVIYRYQTLNELKIRPYMSVLKLLFLVELRKKGGELVISITSCRKTIILKMF